MNSKISLDTTESKKLLSTLKANFINLYRILYELDPKEADQFQALNHHYYDKFHCKQHGNDHHDHEHSHSTQHKSSGHCHDHEKVMKEFYIPEKELSFAQKALYEFNKEYKLIEILPSILDDLGKKFENIKQGGIKDNLEWDDKTEEFVLNKVLTEGIIKAFVSLIKKEIQRDQRVESKQPLLLATPQSWYEKFPKIKLDFLDSDTIKSLFDKGFAIKRNFIPENNFVEALAHEVKYFYHEGRFEEVSTNEEKTRNDRLLTFSFTDIDPKTSKGLYYVSRMLTALPFEFNLKASIYTQVSELFQLSYFHEEKGFQEIHYDSSFQEKFDNGKKISVLYIFSDKEIAKEKPKLTVYAKESREVLEEISLKSGSLYLIKSRVLPYSLSDIPRGTFILRYWVNGPTDNINKTM